MGILNLIKRFITSRMFLLITAMVLQTALLALGSYYIYKYPFVKVLSLIIDIYIIVHIINREINTTYKLVWAIEVLLFPLTGSIVYLLFAEQKIPKALKSEIIESIKSGYNILDENKVISKIKDSDVKKIMEYTKNASKMNCYQNSDVTYFKSGDLFFDDLFEKIKNAKRFVFIEFFIVIDGILFRRFVDLLEQKVKEGVEIYFMYDDGGLLGCTTITPFNPKKILEDIGVKVAVFSPISIHLSLLSKMNNRNHRKICVIDNKYAYTGGYNVADEYPNYKEVYGYWKDTGIRVDGEAVNSYTVMFIQFYNVFTSVPLAYDEYVKKTYKVRNDSFVLGFSDSPTDIEDIGRNVHMSLISSAKKYIYIHTPYLIIDYDMIVSLTRAAKSGVEVIVTVPHIPDKKTVFQVTKSNCEKLIKGGVKVYEFTPGFLHSKMIIVDDKIALNGTINMDFRSYYLNYETGILMANTDEIKEMKKDYLDTLKVSKEITMVDIENINFFVRKFREIMSVLSALL